MDTQTYKNPDKATILSADQVPDFLREREQPSLRSNFDTVRGEQHEAPNEPVDFTPPQMDLQETLLTIKSGVRPDDHAYAAVRFTGEVNDPNGERAQEEKEKEHARMQHVSRSYLAMSDNAESAVKHLSTAAKYYKNAIKSNISGAQIRDDQIARYPDGSQVQSPEDMSKFLSKQTECPPFRMYSVEEMTMIDNVTYDSDAFVVAMEANEELREQMLETQELMNGLENGTLSLDDMTPDQQALVAAIEGNGGLMPEEAAPQTVLEMLNDFETPAIPANAGFQQQVKVVPAFSPTPGLN